MGRKKKDLPLLEGVEITAVAAEGNALTRVDEMVVFVPYGAPGDIADVKIDRRKRSYAEGHIERIIKPSPLRVEPRCEHFGVCGGCRWQHLPYSYQLRCKQQQVTDALQRIAKIDLPETRPTKWDIHSPTANGSHSISSAAARRCPTAMRPDFIYLEPLTRCSISTDVICRMISPTVCVCL